MSLCSKCWGFSSPDFVLYMFSLMVTTLSLQHSTQSEAETQMIYITVETGTCGRGNLTKMKTKTQLEPQL